MTMEDGMSATTPAGMPAAQGLYHPAHEHDACGGGFVVDMKGRKSHAIVSQALQVLKNLLHRGACGCEVNTGDGAGILIQMPHAFLTRECATLGFGLPAPKAYGAGLVFLPTDPAQAAQCQAIFEQVIQEEGQTLLGWRDVRTDDSPIGPSAKAVEPIFRQIFIGRNPAIADHQAFERRLYVIRKRVEHAVYGSDMPQRKLFYVPSLSSNTLIYKGMLSADQIETMYPDIVDPIVESGLALVHQRFSTNTFPSWPLAHPYRYLAHNGEINTLRGNINWMRAREALCETPLVPDLKKILPIVLEGGSDSAIFDNVLEFLVMAGRPLPHAVLMMIPEPWSGHESMPDDLRAFSEYHGCPIEPWAGPAPAEGPGAGPRDGAPAAAGLRLHPRRSTHPDGADGPERRGAGGLHGDRHLAGRALQPPAPPLRLLQAALRPGDQSAAGRDPGRAGDPDVHDDRAGAEPPRARARELSPDQAQDPGAGQRGAGADPLCGPPGLQGHHPPHAFPCGRRRGGSCPGPGGAVPQGRPGCRPRVYLPHPVGPGRG